MHITSADSLRSNLNKWIPICFYILCSVGFLSCRACQLRCIRCQISSLESQNFAFSFLPQKKLDVIKIQCSFNCKEKFSSNKNWGLILGLDRYTKKKKVLKQFSRIIQFQNSIWDHNLLSEVSIYSLWYFNLLLK